MDKPESFARLKLTVALLAAIAFVFDLWYIYDTVSSDGKFEHIPFLYPLVFAFIAGGLELVDRRARALSDDQRLLVRQEARSASAFHPDNLPIERAREGRIE